ncbi:MAG TPA: YceI family protein [Herpetosiphonaceae bacterium]
MTVKRLLGVIGALVLVGVAVLAYSFFKPTKEASQPIEAIPLASSAPAATATVAPTAASGAAQPTAAPTSAPADVTQPPAGETAGTTQIVEIKQDESEARFLIDEVLEGAPKTVIGTTNQVAGQIEINAANPAATRVGTIQVNARTLTTDSEFRNRAIKNRILRTDDFEYVTFTPTSLSGLPPAGEVGKPYTFQISGDLTIVETTKPVVFEVTVTATSATRIEGTASVVIRYADFGLEIPSSPAVASVEDDVKLELEFVAEPKS